MTTPNHATDMQQLSPGLWGCRDDEAIKRKLKAAGLYQQMAESIRTSPSKDLMLLHHDAQGAHAFVYHSNPRDPGFTYYLAEHPAMLLPLLAWFAE